MTSHPEDCTPQWKAALLVGVVALFSLMYFYEGGGWNQNSRFDLLRAIIEHQTLRIDAYHENTQDVAHFQGHYYSDKAPGLVFMALPGAVIARSMLRVLGVEPQSARGEFALSYIVTVFTVALPASLAGVCLFFLGLRFGSGVPGAAFGALIMCLGTPIWAYASLFWAHAVVGACLLFAFAAAVHLRDTSSQYAWALAVGLAAGWATVTEYPAAPASAVLGLLALSQVWSQGSSARWRVVAGVGIGALVCLCVLLGYLHAAFGAFRPSYSYYDPNSFSFMQQQGYMGLTYPHPDRLLKLLFGCSRGLFFASPICLAAVVGVWWLKRVNRAAAFVAGGIAAYYFLFNSSFYWWKAGLSFGPRYAGAAIPLLCLGLSLVWSRVSQRWRRILVAFAVVSVFVTLMAVSTTSQLAMQDSCPLVHSAWPGFLAGKVAMNRDSLLTVGEAASGNYGAFNLGQLLGLRGLVSLIPLLVVWGVAGLAWIWIRRPTARVDT
ncbi:MAG TPA: hypothetical protein VM715_22220 [Candidatus Acidoferrum sp.]|nr:hypothetical protein [Candidatus Acidoferrum sp.]